MRTFIRHPSNIPIEIHPEHPVQEKEEPLKNVSAGGLSFHSDVPFDVGMTLKIKISLVNPIFEAKGKVVWCRKEDSSFDIGLEFSESKDVFRARMIEQICHIEQYKKEIREKEGRELSGKEAALEWISKYANTFEAEPTKK